MPKVTVKELQHVAIIMDGNGRWATGRELPRTEGHKAGAEALDKILRHVGENTTTTHLTVFAFAIKNGAREKSEVTTLQKLAQTYAITKSAELRANKVRVRFVGDLKDSLAVPRPLLLALKALEKVTSRCKGLHLQVAWNYSGENEIVRASKAGWSVDMLYRTMFDAPDVPPIDLLIRTGVDNPLGLNWRQSDFFPLLSAHAVCVPFDVLWPDMTSVHIDHAFTNWRKETHLNGGQRTETISCANVA